MLNLYDSANFCLECEPYSSQVAQKFQQAPIFTSLKYVKMEFGKPNSASL